MRLSRVSRMGKPIYGARLCHETDLRMLINQHPATIGRLATLREGLAAWVRFHM